MVRFTLYPPEKLPHRKEVRRVYVCPKCGGTEVKWHYGLKVAICSSCGTPLSKWEIHEKTYGEIVPPKELEIRPEQVVTKVIPQMEKQTSEEVRVEISKELKPIEIEIPPETEQEPQPKIPKDLLPSPRTAISEKELMPEEIVWMDIDELVVDPCNVRRGKWEYDEADEELIRDIKEHRIENPLRVRPLYIDGVTKYGIVQGGRRYSAAIEAGISKVPCLIKKWDDTEARIQSFRENRLRKDTPRWMDIEQIGETIEGLGDEETLENRISEVSRRTGISNGAVWKYWNIHNLPEAVRGLLRKPDDRSPWLKEYLMLFQKRRTSKILTIGNAALIAQELRDFLPAKQMEVASFLLDKPYDKAKKLVAYLKKRPDEPLEELYDEILTGISKISRIVYFDSETIDALEDACLDRQTFYRDLILRIIKNWLRENGYL